MNLLFERFKGKVRQELNKNFDKDTELEIIGYQRDMFDKEYFHFILAKNSLLVTLRDIDFELIP